MTDLVRAYYYSNGMHVVKNYTNNFIKFRCGRCKAVVRRFEMNLYDMNEAQELAILALEIHKMKDCPYHSIPELPKLRYIRV